MPSSTELLAVAELLSKPTGSSPPTDAQLRRAVSTAYYALFHSILRAAAERFMGPGQERTAAFSLIYRGFDHRQIRSVCEAIQVPSLNTRYRVHLRRSAVSQDMRSVATIFPELQSQRHLADYDPSARFDASDVMFIIESAALAIEAFDRVQPDEKADVLALMMVGVR